MGKKKKEGPKTTTITVQVGELEAVLNAVSGVADNRMPYSIADQLAEIQETVLAKVEVFVDQHNKLIEDLTDGAQRIDPDHERYGEWVETVQELKQEEASFDVEPVDERMLRKLPRFETKATHLRLLRSVGILYDGGMGDAEKDG